MRIQKIVKLLTEEQCALFQEMEKRLPDLKKLLAESEFEIAVEEGK